MDKSKEIELQEINTELRKQVKQWERVPELKRMKEVLGTQEEEIADRNYLIAEMIEALGEDHELSKKAYGMIDNPLGIKKRIEDLEEELDSQKILKEAAIEENERLKLTMSGKTNFDQVEVLSNKVERLENGVQQLKRVCTSYKDWSDSESAISEIYNDLCELLTNNPLNKEER